MIDINFKENPTQYFDSQPITGHDKARSLGHGLAKKTLVMQKDDAVLDLSREIEDTDAIKFFTWEDEEGKKAFWHTSAHLLAYALQELYPGIKLGTGPAIARGFYYDVDFGDYKFTEEDFGKVEKKMLALAIQKSPNIRKKVTKEEAVDFFTRKNDSYKLELIEGLKDDEITFYETGNFTDLCLGPHIPDTSPIKAVKLTALAGAYWRGNEKKPHAYKDIWFFVS